MPTSTKVNDLLAGAEAHKAECVVQGWKHGDFCSQLEVMFGLTKSARVAVFFEKRGRMTVGSTAFPKGEASYIVSAAGNAVAGNVSMPVGVTDDLGKRWLLTPGLRQLKLQRGEFTFTLRPKQVKAAQSTRSLLASTR